jgi:hypothetical protein
MELIKKKILLEDSIDRSAGDNWGTLTADTFYINIFLKETIDDMGLFTDISFISADTSTSNSVDYSILTTKLLSSNIFFPFMLNITPANVTAYTPTDQYTLRLTSKTESDYYNFGNLRLSGSTDSKLEELISYDINEKYKVGFDMGKSEYLNYNNILINGVDRVVSVGEPIIYTFDGQDNLNIGTENQTTGLKYSDYSGLSRTITIEGVESTVPLTIFTYIGEGWNETNTSLSAITKEEYLFGIVSTPEVKSDVFIDRGIVSVFEPHLILSEVKNLGELTRYGNGYYNITRE